MALIHWGPLNGDTKDYGLSPVNVVNNGATIDNSGKIGKCYTFNGSSSYLGIPPSNANEMQYNIFSLTAWVYINSASNTNSIVGCWESGGVGIQVVSAVPRLLVYANSQYYIVNAASSISINTWVHIAATYDNRYLKIYINGSLSNTLDSGATRNVVYNQSTPWCIGSNPWSNGYGPSEQLNGKLNDVRIYDHVLTPKEVKEISKALILHYNPDHAIRSSCGSGDYNFHWVGPMSEKTQSTISDSSLPSGDYRKITGTAGSSTCGPYFVNRGPSTDGSIYTTSFYWKSKGYKPGLNAENYNSIKIYTTLAPNGGGYTQIVGTYNASASYVATTFYGNPPDGTACELDVSSIKIEPGDFATPYRRDNKSYIPDASGFGHDGTIVSEAIEKSTDHKYKKNIIADGDPAHYIQSDINPSFLTSGVTFSVWYKNITNKTFLIANGQSTSYYVTAMDDTNKWCGGVSGATYYIDGEPRTAADGYPKDGQGHMYTSVHTSIGGGTALYWNRHDTNWAYKGPLGDIRLYATALSAADVKALYNETRVTHPMQFLVSNSSTLSSLTSSNPVLADGELVVVRSTDSAGKTYFNIRKGNGVNNFNSLPGKQISETVLKGGRDSFSSDSTALTADANSYTQLGEQL